MTLGRSRSLLRLRLFLHKNALRPMLRLTPSCTNNGLRNNVFQQMTEGSFTMRGPSAAQQRISTMGTESCGQSDKQGQSVRFPSSTLKREEHIITECLTGRQPEGSRVPENKSPTAGLQVVRSQSRSLAADTNRSPHLTIKDSGYVNTIHISVRAHTHTHTQHVLC
jgi:hypothetical protein